MYFESGLAADFATAIGGAVACALAAAGMPKASGGRSAQNASTLLVHVLAKLHNIACDRKIPVSNSTRPCKMDSYRGRVPGRGGGDLVGRDWAEWRIPNKYFDPQDTNRGRPGTRQPLRDELAERLEFASLGRPKRSQYVGYERDPRPTSD